MPTANDSMSLSIAELREFAAFSPSEQRYIKRSLDVGLGRQDAFRLWARTEEETSEIRMQYLVYQDLKDIRKIVPEDLGLDPIETFMGKLVRVTAYDLSQERLNSFSAYRFLYERLISADIRPWLPSAFCGAAALPHIRPDRRKHLLQSISEAAATAPGWSSRAPIFYPEWIDKMDLGSGPGASAH
jgi:hypothetical protein